MLFDMVDGGAGDEHTLRRNETALAEIELSPKAPRRSGETRPSVELFGHKLPSPILIGPTGLAGLLWPHAELAAARAAARFGTFYSTSHASTATLEEIAKATQAPKLMQVFLYKDRGLTAEFVRRAAAAGYEGLDPHRGQSGHGGTRSRRRQRHELPAALDARAAFCNSQLKPGWLLRMRETPSPTFVNYGARTSISAFGPLMIEQLDPDIGWRDVEQLRQTWRGPC